MGTSAAIREMSVSGQWSPWTKVELLLMVLNQTIRSTEDGQKNVLKRTKQHTTAIKQNPVLTYL